MPKDNLQIDRVVDVLLMFWANMDKSGKYPKGMHGAVQKDDGVFLTIKQLMPDIGMTETFETKWDDIVQVSTSTETIPGGAFFEYKRQQRAAIAPPPMHPEPDLTDKEKAEQADIATLIKPAPSGSNMPIILGGALVVGYIAYSKPRFFS